MSLRRDPSKSHCPNRMLAISSIVATPELHNRTIASGGWKSDSTTAVIPDTARLPIIAIGDGASRALMMRWRSELIPWLMVVMICSC
jgi:hypothetical protein